MERPRTPHIGFEDEEVDVSDRDHVDSGDDDRRRRQGHGGDRRRCESDERDDQRRPSAGSIGRWRYEDKADAGRMGHDRSARTSAVSYTHLTLPTIYSV